MGVHPSGYRVCRYSKEGMSVGQVEAGGVSVKAERGGEGMQQQVQQQVEEGERVFDVNSLKAYYAFLFPFAEMTRWLSYCSPSASPEKVSQSFRLREFSFTLENDIYVRFKSFTSYEDFKNKVIELNPHKIDIGAIYNAQPTMKAAVGKFFPIEREFVFDIDMTDYDDVRKCCSNAQVCKQCWGFISAAIKVLHTSLVEDFGFKHIMWVFSGRRGVHCWISDPVVRKFDSDQREKLVKFFSLYKGGANNSLRPVKLQLPLHPSLIRAHSILNPIFENVIIKEQDLLSYDSHVTKLTSMIDDAKLRSLIKEKLSIASSLNGPDKWNIISKVIKLFFEVEQNRIAAKRLGPLFQELVFAHLYPRLDEKVSTQMNHLLKAPFCVHPKTGKVCIPIDPNTCDSFDPSKVPTLSQLVLEINQHGPDKTSLRPYIESFKRHVSGIQKEILDEVKTLNSSSMEF